MAAVCRVAFIDESRQARIRTAEAAPILNRYFDSSVSGLYFVGAAAANSFGPLLRFAFGAKFAAERVAARLATAYAEFLVALKHGRSGARVIAVSHQPLEESIASPGKGYGARQRDS